MQIELDEREENMNATFAKQGEGIAKVQREATRLMCEAIEQKLEALLKDGANQENLTSCKQQVGKLDPEVKDEEHMTKWKGTKDCDKRLRPPAEDLNLPTHTTLPPRSPLFASTLCWCGTTVFVPLPNAWTDSGQTAASLEEDGAVVQHAEECEKTLGTVKSAETHPPSGEAHDLAWRKAMRLAQQTHNAHNRQLADDFCQQEKATRSSSTDPNDYYQAMATLLMHTAGRNGIPQSVPASGRGHNSVGSSLLDSQPNGCHTPLTWS